MLQILQTALGDILARVATSLLLSILALVSHTGVHDAAFASLSPHNLTSVGVVTASFVVLLSGVSCILLLENACTSALDPRGLPLLVIALLRHFLILLALVLVLFRRGDLIALLLHSVGLLTLVAWSLLFTLAGHTAEFLVALDKVIQALVVHLEIHLKGDSILSVKI